MVKKATGSQSTDTVPRQGQNKPVPGGNAGAGDRRGTAKLPTTGLLSPPMGPGTKITGKAADRMMAEMQRQAKRQGTAKR